MNLKKLFVAFSLLVLMSISVSFAFNVELIRTNPTPIVAGDYADITLRFTNNLMTGDNRERRDVSFFIDNTNFITQVSQEDSVISRVNSGETFTRTFRVYFSDKLEAGFIDLPVKIRYDGITIKKDLRIYVESAQKEVDLRIGQINTIPKELIRDSDNNKFNIIIQNLGQRDAELVSARLISLDSSFKESYSFSTQDSLASIGAGSQEVLSFEIDVENINFLQLPAKLELNYRSKKGISNLYESNFDEIYFNISLRSSPYLIVESFIQEDDFKLGSNENRLRVTIRNDGLEEAREVRARIISDISNPFSVERSTQYVTTNIKPGESADVIFKFEVSKDADIKDYSSIIVLESLVGQARYSREDFILITPQFTERMDYSSIGTLVVILIIIVSILLGFNTHRNKTKKKIKKSE